MNGHTAKLLRRTLNTRTKDAPNPRQWRLAKQRWSRLPHTVRRTLTAQYREEVAG